MKLRRVGNTLIVTIPKRVAEAMGWEAGDELQIKVVGRDRLLLRR
ncbi:MAG: AbrB/MazE/SpoVT family DNA-binding domain-containing protein [Thermoplasmata archaeon]